MKNVSLIAVAVSLCVGACSVNAQTCTATPGNAPLTWTVAGQNFPIDTCTATNQLASACSGLSPIGNAPDMIWQLTVTQNGPIGVALVTPTGTPWDPYLVIMAGACSGASTCIVDADNEGAGLAELGPIPGIGDYWLMITDESGITTCGTANLSFTFPVTLQSFSID